MATNVEEILRTAVLWGVDVGEPSLGTKGPPFGKSLKTFISERYIFKKD